MIQNTTLEKIEGVIKKPFICKLNISGREIDIEDVNDINVGKDELTIKLSIGETIMVSDILVVLFDISHKQINMFGNDNVIDVTLSL